MNYNFVVCGQSNGVALVSRLQTKVDLAFPNDTVTVISCAVGGTTIEEWQKGHTSGLYQGMVNAVNGCTLDLIVFWQGEANTQNETEAKTWRQNMLQLIADWRVDFTSDALIFIMQLGQDPDPTRATYPNWWDCWACQATFDNIPTIDPVPLVKVLSTLHLPCDPVTPVHKTNAGYNTAANNIITKFKNIKGL